jgi:cyanosortase A-associated protein
MSTPLKTASNSGTTASEEAAYKDLESAWFSWYQWWQANYPSP